MNKFIEMFKEVVNVSDLIKSLTVTWQGLLAIFIVMAVIAAIVFLFSKFSSIIKK